MDPNLAAALAAAIGLSTSGMGSAGVSADTIQKVQEAVLSAAKLDQIPQVAKTTFVQSGSATSGLTAYDLEAPAKLLYPVLTPLRNMIPRVSGKGGIQAAWRAVTGINTGRISAGVSEGNRGGVIDVSTADYVAAYRGIGYESSATFEAQYASEGFDNVRARASTAGLQSLMLDEEKILLGGNGTVALGTTGTPSLSASASGGSLATATYSVICVALTMEGYNLASVAGGVVQTYTRNNADGTSDVINGGCAQKSANATVAVTGPTGKITATVAAKRAAMAYAWFWGAAGSEVLGAITTVPTYTVTAAATGTQAASTLTAADKSVNSLIFDGLLTQALKSGSGAYWADLGGATLTADGKAGVVEIDAAMKDRWDNYRLTPDTIWVSSQEQTSITKAVMEGTTTSALRLVQDVNKGMVAGGSLVTSYLNKYGLNGAIPITVRPHPFLTPGTILMTSSTLPYALNGVDNVFQVRTRQDYYQIEWPWRSRKYEYGVYADEVLQHYFPPSMVVITGIGAS